MYKTVKREFKKAATFTEWYLTALTDIGLHRPNCDVQKYDYGDVLCDCYNYIADKAAAHEDYEIEMWNEDSEASQPKFHSQFNIRVK